MGNSQNVLPRLRELPTEWVCIDVETTGFGRDDRVIQYGMARMRQGVVVHTYSLLIRPEPWKDSHPKAEAVHGLTRQMLELAPSFSSQVARIVAGHLAGSVVVAHNLPFDRRMLTGELTRHGLAWPDTIQEVCTQAVAKAMPEVFGGQVSLKTAAEAVGLELRSHHDALSDAIAAGQILWAARSRT